MRVRIMFSSLIAVLVLASPAFSQAAEDRPRLFACGPMAFAGQTLCVCGRFPASSANAILMDGNPLGVPVAVSETSLAFRIPDGVESGLHTIRGMPEAGFSASDAIVTTVLKLAAEIDQNAMLRGQSTRARFRVFGTTSPLRLRVANRSPGVVSVEGGVEQSLMTSGGLDNAVIRRVLALARGDFAIDVELAGETCPCARQDARNRSIPAPPGAPAGQSSEDPRGFLNARIVALVPLAAQQAMAATAQALAAANGLAVAEVTPLASSGDGLVVFTIPNAADVLPIVAALNADPRVRVAEPDFIFESNTAFAQHAVRGDSLKYGGRLIGLDRVNPGFTGKDVPVAIIDTGVDIRHPALMGRLKLKADVTASGYSGGFHGTLVAGVIADLAPRAPLLSIQACLPLSDQSIAALCSSATLVKALNIAIEKRARIINLSLGGPSSRLVERLIEQAVRSGAAVVAAAGNGGSTATPAFPAVMNHVIAVTAVDAAQSVYPYATRGSFIDLAAPGVEILSAAPGGQWLVFSGTSAAAPHVSAVLAVMFQQRRTLDPAEAQSVLERSAHDLGAAGKDPNFGSGLVDACRSLLQLPAGTPCR